MRYNRKFELNPKQINLIEQALYMYDPNTEDGKEANFYHIYTIKRIGIVLKTKFIFPVNSLFCLQPLPNSV